MSRSKPNRLINEQSPYLRQHAYNPVDWYPWGEEALQKARAKSMPILLSIGYSACHWCHVMERECFENQEIAEIMNKHFINIKVDREERPDLDQLYQRALEALSGQGGWPLTIFLLPDLRPFYGGTYFPPYSRYGRPGFKDVLEGCANLYKENPQQIEEAAKKTLQVIKIMEDYVTPTQPPSQSVLVNALNYLDKYFDKEYGGLGNAPKFPMTQSLELLLRVGKKNEDAHHKVFFTLDAMAAGGIYDHLGGGFHRYSTDRVWLAPHFEKMLYDNALLPPLYLRAYQITGKEKYLKVAEETLDYILHEMTHPKGGFYSTTDADSEGEEGKFYLWDQSEIEKALPELTAQLFCRFYGVSKEGNFEGKNILHITSTLDELADEVRLSKNEVESHLTQAKKALYRIREERIRPFRDEKIITSWNGLMIHSLALAGFILENNGYIQAAKKAAQFIKENLTDGGETHLLRIYKDTPLDIPGFLDDYAMLIFGLITLYEACGDSLYLVWAINLCHSMIRQFWDEKGHTFFFTQKDSPHLIHRPNDLYDQSTPASNSIAIMNLLRLSPVEDGFFTIAEKALKQNLPLANRSPLGMSSLLCAFDLYTRGLVQIVVSAPSLEEAKILLEPLCREYLPNASIYQLYPNQTPSLLDKDLFAERLVNSGSAKVFICKGQTCLAPMSDKTQLIRVLKEL